MDDSVNPVAREELWQRAVSDLTRAAKLTRPGPAGPEPADFPEFVTTVLAAVAANVGSIPRTVEGRPGSWEANHVEHLLSAAVGWGVEDLMWHRTEPIELNLNVAELVEDTGCGPSYDAAMQRIPMPGRTEQRNGRIMHGVGATEAEWETYERELDGLFGRYASAYEEYAQRFKEAAEQTVDAIPALRNRDGSQRIPLVVHTDAHPEGFYSQIVNPTEWEDGETMEWHFWNKAREAAGWPALPESVTQVAEGIPAACAPSRARIVEDREPPASPGSPSLGGPAR